MIICHDVVFQEEETPKHACKQHTMCIEHLHVALQYDPHATILLLQPTQAT
jgi:hypothetical protein